VGDINAALHAANRPSLAALAKAFGLTADALERHAAHHLAQGDPPADHAAGAGPDHVDDLPGDESGVGGEHAHGQHVGGAGVDGVEHARVDRRLRAARGAAKADAKQRFLERYRASGNLSQAASAAGVGRKTVYQWQEVDEQFSLRMREAENEAIDALELEARERATAGSTLTREVWRGDRMVERIVERRPSDAMLIKLLQALRPEKYGDKLAVTQTQIVKTVEKDIWDAI
jgi:hypothetical protein